MLRHQLLPISLLNASFLFGAPPASPIEEKAVLSQLPRLEKFIESGLQKTGVPGLAVGIVYRDQVIYLKGFGVRREGNPALVDVDTVFQLASLSKPITSTIIASLVSTHTVQFDDRIAELDPGFKLSNPAVGEQVTIRDFLSHRSGLPEAAGDNLEDLGYTRPEILDRMRFLPLTGEFRQTYAYTNFGYTEGAIAAAKKTPLRWEDLAVERLYGPLGMTSTSSRFSDYVNANNKAFGHVFENGKPVDRYLREPDSESPAGGVSSSVRDLTQWLRLQLASGVWDGNQIIEADALNETHKPEIVTNPTTGEAYGMGWDIGSDKRGNTLLSHSGAFTLGAGTTVLLSQADQLGIVVLTNALPVGLAEAVSKTFFDYVLYGDATREWLPFYGGIFKELLTSLNNSSTDYSKLPPPVQPTPPQALSSYVGTYHNDYYGNLEITTSVDQLLLHLPPKGASYPLKHWNASTFVYPFAGETGIGTRGVVFSQGSPSQVLVENLATEGSGVFVRVLD